jgi:hypothetical protein
MDGNCRGLFDGTVSAFTFWKWGKPKEVLSQNNRYPNRDLTPGPLKYEPLITTSGLSVNRQINAYKFSAGKAERKSPLGRNMGRCEDNIKTNLRGK